MDKSVRFVVSRRNFLRAGTLTAAVAALPSSPAQAAARRPAIYPPGNPGDYKPSATTTGYTAAGQSTLTPYPTTGGPAGNVVNGVLKITTAGTTLSGYLFSCRVAIAAANVTVRRSKITGSTSETLTADAALLDCTNTACVNALVEDCNLAPVKPSLYLNGIRGHDFTVRRTDIRGVVDGVDMFRSASPGSNLAINFSANYIHDLAGFGPDTPNNRPFTHNDCIQILGGTGVTIVGNNLQGFLDMSIGQAGNPTYDPNYIQNPSPSNAVLQTNQSSTFGNVRGLVFDKNWLNGGSATINIAANVSGGGVAGNAGSITNNQFGRGSYYQGGAASADGHPGAGGDNAVVFSAFESMTFTAPNVPITGNAGAADPNGNNTFEDNGHKILVRRYA